MNQATATLSRRALFAGAAQATAAAAVIAAPALASTAPEPRGPTGWFTPTPPDRDDILEVKWWHFSWGVFALYGEPGRQAADHAKAAGIEPAQLATVLNPPWRREEKGFWPCLMFADPAGGPSRCFRPNGEDHL